MKKPTLKHYRTYRRDRLFRKQSLLYVFHMIFRISDRKQRGCVFSLPIENTLHLCKNRVHPFLPFYGSAVTAVSNGRITEMSSPPTVGPDFSAGPENWRRPYRRAVLLINMRKSEKSCRLLSSEHQSGYPPGESGQKAVRRRFSRHGGAKQPPDYRKAGINRVSNSYQNESFNVKKRFFRKKMQNR